MRKKHFRGVEIKVQPNGNFDVAIKKFRRKVDREGIFRDIRRQDHFVSKSEKRREKESAGKRRQAKRDEKRAEL